MELAYPASAMPMSMAEKEKLEAMYIFLSQLPTMKSDIDDGR